MAWFRTFHEEQGAGHGSVWVNRRGGGKDSQPRVPHQQEALDQFLCDLHRRTGSALPRVVLLDRGCQTMAGTVDEAAASVRNECDCRLCVCRNDVSLAGFMG